MDQGLPDHCQVEAWRPGIEGICEVFHARIVNYGYPKHCHDTWTVLLVDRGAISYDLDNRRCGAVGQTVAILPPGVTHDGKPAPGTAGFTKRNLYLDETFLPAALIGSAVDRTNIDDPALRCALAELHRELAGEADPLHAESSLALIAERITGHLEASPSSRPAAEATIAGKLRELLDDGVHNAVSLGDAAALLERSKAHLVRSFTSSYGLAPHAYLIGRRVEAARQLLLDGMSAADTAATVGFYDQAHLTRHFKRHTSVTPAKYAASHVRHLP